MGADGFFELTPESLKTVEGINELNRMLKNLHEIVAGDGVKQKVYNGVGSPEGVVSADIGSLYLRLDGGAGSSFYVKESGTGATGWTAK